MVVPLSLERFSAEELTWLHQRVTGLRLMIPQLDPVFRSLVTALADHERPGVEAPSELVLELRETPAADLSLARGLIAQLVRAAEREGHGRPGSLLAALGEAVDRSRPA